jgi:hypothetical protein
MLSLLFEEINGLAYATARVMMSNSLPNVSLSVDLLGLCIVAQNAQHKRP